MKIIKCEFHLKIKLEIAFEILSLKLNKKKMVFECDQNF